MSPLETLVVAWVPWVVGGGGRLMNTVSGHPFVALGVVVLLAGLAIHLARRQD